MYPTTFFIQFYGVAKVKVAQEVLLSNFKQVVSNSKCTPLLYLHIALLDDTNLVEVVGALHNFWLRLVVLSTTFG